MVHAVAHVPGTWRLLYYDAPTRGEQIRLLFALGGVPLQDVRLWPFPSGLDPYRKAALGADSPLLGTDKCPCVTAPDGTHCVETSNIMHFVGHQIGMAPQTEEADERAVNLCLIAQELLDEVFYPLLMPMLVRHLTRTELLGLLRPLSGLLGDRSAKVEPAVAALRARLPALERALEASGGTFFSGEALTFESVALFNALRDILAYECVGDELASYPRLAAFMAALEARARPYFEERTATHQCGYPDVVSYLAATNTPFPWSRVAKQRD